MIFFIHEIKMNMKSFLIWALSIGGMVFGFMLLFPSMETSISEISGAFADMGSFSQAFGMDKINFTTPMGYYGIEAGVVISIGGSMFAAILGISLLAKEEGNHVTEFIYSSPNTRNYFLSSKLAAMAVLFLLFHLICAGMGLLGFFFIKGEILQKEFLLYHIAQYIMQLEIGCICFGISAFLKKNNVGMGIGIAILLYFINIFANITDKVDMLHYITPFYYSDGADIFSTGKIQIEYMIPGIVIALLGVITGYIQYNRKDMSV